MVRLILKFSLFKFYTAVTDVKLVKNQVGMWGCQWKEISCMINIGREKGSWSRLCIAWTS